MPSAEFVAALPADSDTRDFIVATDARRRGSTGLALRRVRKSSVRTSRGKTGGVARIVCEPGVGGETALIGIPDLVAANTVTVMPPTHPSARWIEWIAAQEMATGHTVPNKSTGTRGP